MSNVDFNSPEMKKVLDKVEKLLRLASNNPNEAEAASASAKAQEILAQYQLDISALEQASGKNQGRREENKLAGGLYKWQREIWQGVAELNFCLYWSIRGLTKGSKYEHRLIGRKVNILATKLMAEYLEQTIERITRENYGNNSYIYFSKAGIAYREGMADRIREKLRARRREVLEAERAKAEATRASGGASTSTALTVANVTTSEYEANQEFEYDLKHGPGAWAEMKAANARWRAEAQRQAEEARIAREEWERTHPEEAAAQKAQAEKEQREWQKREERNARRRTGRSYGSYKGPRHSDYYKGHERGGSVSLDQQVDRSSPKAIK